MTVRIYFFLFQHVNCYLCEEQHLKTYPEYFFSDNFDIQMRRCFAFDETDTKLQLVDNRGCAIERLISDFTYDKNAGTAEATLYSMFRLPHSNRTYFQCDVLICRGKP